MANVIRGSMNGDMRLKKPKTIEKKGRKGDGLDLRMASHCPCYPSDTA